MGGGLNGGEEKWMGSGCVLVVEPIGFADRLDEVECV